MQPVLCMSHCHFCSYTFRWENDILFVCYFIRLKSSSIWLQTVSIDLIVLNIEISCHFIWFAFCFALRFSLRLSMNFRVVFCSAFSFELFRNDIVLNEPDSDIYTAHKLPNDSNKMFEKLLCYEIKNAHSDFKQIIVSLWINQTKTIFQQNSEFFAVGFKNKSLQLNQ